MNVIEFYQRYRESRKFRERMNALEADIRSVLSPISRQQDPAHFIFALGKVLKDTMVTAHSLGCLTEADRNHIVDDLTNIIRKKVS